MFTASVNPERPWVSQTVKSGIGLQDANIMNIVAGVGEWTLKVLSGAGRRYALERTPIDGSALKGRSA